LRAWTWSSPSANEALWRIVLVRMKSHAPTRAYVARRTAEGLSKREIMRCLKRYVAREVYRYFKPTDHIPRMSPLTSGVLPYETRHRC
jgi:hypothetical protein